MKPATLLKVTLLHWCISRFLHWASGTKSRKASRVVFSQENSQRAFPKLFESNAVKYIKEHFWNAAFACNISASIELFSIVKRFYSVLLKLFSKLLAEVLNDKSSLKFFNNFHFHVNIFLYIYMSLLPHNGLISLSCKWQVSSASPTRISAFSTEVRSRVIHNSLSKICDWAFLRILLTTRRCLLESHILHRHIL